MRSVRLVMFLALVASGPLVAQGAELNPFITWQWGGRAPTLTGDLEIAASENDWDGAIAEFTEAVELEDALPYTEPPPWYFSNRLALGKAYLKAGRLEQAETVYRDALLYRRRSGWALFGLAQSLRAQGKDDSAATVEARFAEAWQRADIDLQSSMF